MSLVVRTYRLLAALLLGGAVPLSTLAATPVSGQPVTVDALQQRIESAGIGYVFIGEEHANGPIKRFAVDLANALVDNGVDVGIYVEGFRTDSEPGEARCWSIARTFNEPAFRALLAQARAPVHPLDPPQRDHRVARMAATVAAGREAVKIVLAGRTHVVFAGNQQAVWWVFGGSMRYPDPGDLVEMFPRDRSLTVGLEISPDASPPYRLRADGHAFDYVLLTRETPDYAGGDAAPAPDATPSGLVRTVSLSPSP